MRITLEFDNLQEMKGVIDQLFVFFPEDEKLTMADIHSPQAEKMADKQPDPEKRTRKRKVDPEKIMKLRQKGMTAKEIAKETGYGYSTVCRTIQEQAYT